MPDTYLCIEAVECPRCGSPRKQPMRAGLCRCVDCGTNYHLNWVGSGGPVRQLIGPLLCPATRWTWLPLKVLLLVVLAMVALAGLSFLVVPK